MKNRKRTILVVEDDSALREAICIYLEDSFDIISSATGEDALKRILATSSIDLLITDFDLLGDLDGLDVARAMSVSHPNTPMILATGSAATLPRIQELLSIANAGLLKKPYEIASLEWKIQSMMNESRPLIIDRR